MKLNIKKTRTDFKQNRNRDGKVYEIEKQSLCKWDTPERVAQTTYLGCTVNG